MFCHVYTTGHFLMRSVFFLFFILTTDFTLDASFQEKDSLRKRWELLQAVEEGTPGLRDHPFIRQSEKEFHNLAHLAASQGDPIPSPIRGAMYLDHAPLERAHAGPLPGSFEDLSVNGLNSILSGEVGELFIQIVGRGQFWQSREVDIALLKNYLDNLSPEERQEVFTQVDPVMQSNAIHWALFMKNKDVLEILLSYLPAESTAFEAQDEEGLTPLHRAVYYREVELVRALLEAGASPSVLDRSEQTVLQYCVAQSNSDHFSDVRVRQDQIEIFKNLLDADSSVQTLKRITERGDTVLSTACLLGKTQELKAIFSKLSQEDTNELLRAEGSVALRRTLAFERYNYTDLQLLKLLLEKDSSKDHLSQIVFCEAVEHDKYYCLNKLFSVAYKYGFLQEVLFSPVNDEGQRLLDLAVFHLHHQSVAVILAWYHFLGMTDREISHQDSRGMTCLMHGCHQGAFEVVKQILISCGCRDFIELKNAEGLSALQLAEEASKREAEIRASFDDLTLEWLERPDYAHGYYRRKYDKVREILGVWNPICSAAYLGHEDSAAYQLGVTKGRGKEVAVEVAKERGFEDLASFIEKYSPGLVKSPKRGKEALGGGGGGGCGSESESGSAVSLSCSFSLSHKEGSADSSDLSLQSGKSSSLACEGGDTCPPVLKSLLEEDRKLDDKASTHQALSSKKEATTATESRHLFHHGEGEGGWEGDGEGELETDEEDLHS